MSAAYALRFEAVFFCSHPKRLKMSFSSAAKYIKKSKTFVAKWVQRYTESKNVDDLPECGSSTQYNKKNIKKILDICNKDQPLSLRQDQTELSKKGVKISIKTVSISIKINKIS